MAIQSNIKIWDNCVDFTLIEDVYIRVMWVKTDKENAECSVKIWASKTDREEENMPLKNEMYTFDYDMESSDNVFTQAYNFLKTIFTDAIDI